MNTIQTVPIYITHEDKRRLTKMIDELKRSRTNRDDLTSLVNELDRAIVVESQDIPRDVVTMNSRVEIIDNDTGEKMSFTLVFPQDADADMNKISVLAPVGSGILGYRVDDELVWQVPGGTRSFTIEKVDYQPEDWEHHPFRDRQLTK